MPSAAVEGNTIYDAKTHIWSGNKEKIKYGPKCSIGQVALESLMRDPEHIAQISYPSGRQYTNREIALLSVRVAQHFSKLQLEQCDVIGLCAANSDFVAPLFFGAMLSGLTFSTLDPSFDSDGIRHIFSITKPRIMFCDGSVYKKVKKVFDEFNPNASIYTMKDHIVGVPEISEFVKETGLEANFVMSPLKDEYLQTAAILCSSGTTGLPKGVCMSHANLMNTNILQMGPRDKLLCFSTLYWLSGLFCLIHATSAGATRLLCETGYSPENLFNIVKKYKATILFTPPSQMALAAGSSVITNYDLSSVTSYICGGSAVPYTLVEKIKRFMPNAEINVGYGMSEICGAIAVGIAKPNDTTGQLVPNVEMKIIDDDGKFLGPDEQGEICLRTTFPWAGYYGNLEATKSTCDENGWIHSGDIGYVDEQGQIFIIDRKKDILKYNNFHFSPTEIENVISELPDVVEVCVCGIPDMVSTYLPAAAIMKAEGSTLTEEQVYQYVEDKMAHFKHLRGGVYFMRELPKTASGKNLRRAVTELCVKLRNAQK